jgi:Bacterial RNA polymerase, alpha chain C terminal domain
MSTRSPKDGPAASIRDLGLPGRAVSALTRAGVTTVDQLSALTRRELAAVEGLGPGLIGAIRAVVPEPGQRVEGAVPLPEAEQESPAAPPIPSFESLRDPRRQTPLDVLLPGPSPSPSPNQEPAPQPAPAPAARPATAPRPAEYGDLLRWGLRVARTMAVLPGRVVCWSVRAPVRGARRLLGDQAGQPSAR